MSDTCGFEVGRQAGPSIAPATGEERPYSLRLSDSATTRFHQGPWEMEMEEIDGKAQIMIWYDGERVIRVEGARGVSVTLLQRND